jgi:hypothetical protein
MVNKTAKRSFTDATKEEQNSILEFLMKLLEAGGKAVKMANLGNPACCDGENAKLIVFLRDNNISLKGFNHDDFETVGEGASVSIRRLPKITFGIFKPAESAGPVEVPVEAPVEEPAGKRAGKRAGKPARKPVGKPVEEPVDVEPVAVSYLLIWNIFSLMCQHLTTKIKVKTGSYWLNYCLTEEKQGKKCQNRNCQFLHYKYSRNDLQGTDHLFAEDCYFQCVTFEENGGCTKGVHRCPSCEKVLERNMCTNPENCKQNHTGTPRPLCCDPNCIERFKELGYLIGSSSTGLNRRDFTLHTTSPADLTTIAATKAEAATAKAEAAAAKAEAATAKAEAATAKAATAKAEEDTDQARFDEKVASHKLKKANKWLF